ncbi:MAG: PAS domain S-box protein, partial [Promethearchaeota archaeon]
LRKSEEKYRLITENANDMICVLNHKYRYEYINEQSYLKYLGYANEELIGKSAWQLVHHEDINRYLKEINGKGDTDENKTELRFKHKNGKWVWLQVTIRRFQDKDRGKNKYLLVSREISKQKQAERELVKSEERYRRLIENISDIIFEIDLDGKISYLSPQSIDVMGYNPNELINKNAFRLIHPDDLEEVLKNQKNATTTGEVGSVKFRIQHKDGHYVTVSSRGQLIERSIKKKIVGLFRDITEREMIEERVQQEKDKAELYLNLVNVIIVALDRDGNISMINQKGNDILGWNKGELIGKNWFDNCLPPKDRKMVRDYFMRLIDGESEVVPFYENKVIAKNRKEKLIAWSTILFRDSEGVIQGVLSSGEDITERKKAEEKAQESEKRLIDLIEAVPVGISITTPEGNIIECNSHTLEIFGYRSKEELLRTPVRDIYKNPLDREKFINLLENGLVENFETQFKRRDGSIFWGSLTSIAHRMGDQTNFINSFQDITDRKLAEIKIQQSEAELAAIYNYTPIALLLVDSERKVRKINKYALKFTDRQEEEVFGIHGGEALRCLYSIEDPGGCGFSEYCQDCTIRNTVLDTFKIKIPKINVEATLYLLPGGDTDKVHLLLSTIPLNFDGEDLVLISLIDISDRVNAEQGLKESEQNYRNLSNQYRMLLESITDAVYVLNRDWEYIILNKNAEKIVNMPIENLLGNKIFEVFPGIEGTPFFKSYETVMTTRKAMRITELFTLPDGRTGYYEVSVYPIREGILCIAKDVSEEKEIEQRLLDSEERYRELFESSPVALFEHDYTEMKMYLDHLKASGILDFERYLDENPEEVVKCISKIKIIDVNKKGLDLIKANSKEELIRTKSQYEKELYRNATPEALLTNKREILSLIKGNVTFESEAISKNFIGEKIYIFMKTLVIPGYEKDWSKVIVSILDITTRKKTEQKLKESEEKFRTIAEQSSMGIIIQQNGFIKFANAAVSEILGFSLEELEQSTVEEGFKTIQKEDLPIIVEMLYKTQYSGLDSENRYEFEVFKNLDKFRWIEMFSKPIIYQGEDATLSTFIDITIQKEVEEELKEVSRLKSDLLSRTSHELKTPLVSIKGYADLLLNQHYEELDFYTISILHEIKQGCSRLESLIKDLIETSKLESGEIELNKSKDDLAFLIRFCVRDLQGLLEIRNHKLILEIQEDMNTLLEKERIYEVIINLLSNAIKYTPSGGTIKIVSEIKNDFYIISISDDGIGLTKDEMSKIFQKFGKIERYGKGLDVISEGSGLGLYISKSIIELHGGNIWVESEGRDKGSTFNFSLPILKK